MRAATTPPLMSGGPGGGASIPRSTRSKRQGWTM
nr:MAG TPA_asm: hypothetical protein [Caudoviricetes sp.]DAL95999.1 MAG TPA: hypothetical protein [Caudoviricetes sp.]